MRKGGERCAESATLRACTDREVSAHAESGSFWNDAVSVEPNRARSGTIHTVAKVEPDSASGPIPVGTFGGMILLLARCERFSRLPGWR